MFIAHKSNTLQSYSDSERECRMVAKGMNSTEYNSWIETVTDEEGVVDYSGETGYTIVEFTDENVKDMDKWLLINKKFSAIWPNINKKKDPMPEHKKFEKMKNKFDEHFSEKPFK